jgi:hypothetical protein
MTKDGSLNQGYVGGTLVNKDGKGKEMGGNGNK